MRKKNQITTNSKYAQEEYKKFPILFFSDVLLKFFSEELSSIILDKLLPIQKNGFTGVIEHQNFTEGYFYIPDSKSFSVDFREDIFVYTGKQVYQTELGVTSVTISDEKVRFEYRHLNLRSYLKVQKSLGGYYNDVSILH